MIRLSAWNKYEGASLDAIHAFAAEYSTFIDQCKTERECVSRAVELKAFRSGNTRRAVFNAADGGHRSFDRRNSYNSRRAFGLV